MIALLASVASIPAPAQTPVQADWRREVLEVLERRARAVMRGDARAFEETMAAAPASFRREKRTWFDRVRALQLASYSLAFADPGYTDLVDALDEPPEDEEVHVVQVTERLVLEGYDDRPAAEDLFLTVVRARGRWSIRADDDLDDLGLMSARNLWDFGQVRRIEREGVMVLFHRDPAAARRILDATVAAAGRVRRAWPLRWRPRVVVAIPRTAAELGRILQTTYDLGPFVAFASSSLDRDGGEWRLGGHRVYVQPATFFRTSVAFQNDTLGHEMLHIATRGATGQFVPTWLEEGVAQVYGESESVPPRELGAAVRNGTFERALPEDFIFTVGNRAEIRSAYQAGRHFVRSLSSRYGRTAPARVYRALGSESAVAFGTWRYHLDRAVRAVLGTTFRKVERAWVRRVEGEFGS